MKLWSAFRFTLFIMLLILTAIGLTSWMYPLLLFIGGFEWSER